MTTIQGNPITFTLNWLGCSQSSLALALGHNSGQTLRRLEQGLYEAIPEAITHDLAALISESAGSDWPQDTIENDIRSAYERSRSLTQLRSSHLSNPTTMPEPAPGNDDWHPFEMWRQRLIKSRSRMEFCKLLAINPAVVVEYESGRRSSMPPSIRSSLTNAGFTSKTLDLLNEYGEQYHDQLMRDD